MKISQLKKATKEELKDINELMRQLSSDPSKYPPTKLAFLNKMLADRHTIFVVARDGKKILGMGTLGIFWNLRGLAAYVDNVIVHTDHRGKGMGKQISEKLLEIAKKKKVFRVDLTSSPKREAANKLYQKLGFELRETNAYTIKP